MRFFKLCTVLCISLVIIACKTESAETAKPQAATVEETQVVMAPEFAGKTLEGADFSSQELSGKGYILNFFASWCPPCRAEVPDMIELQNEYEQKGFTFIGVTVDEDLTKARQFVDDFGINFPVLVADQQMINAYSDHVQGGLRSIPTSFVISADGTISSVLVGAQSKMAFDGLIREVIGAGK